ncbi:MULTISPECIES: histidinol-phosphatase [unclassified Carboxylicivirga]|uniref:histidinol-phosphatase n=1 Tax=Carboxylicivirga TaxID=1628153 RepID=UPI003D34AEEB
MGWTNYHGHCEYCDGQGKIEDYITTAIDLKMHALGISSHAPLPFPTDWNMPGYRLSSYLKEVDYLREKYSEEITVYKSLEVDYIPGLASPSSKMVQDAKLDYTVGSVHFVGQLHNGDYWSVDAPVNEFEQGLEETFVGDIKAAVCRYYALQREMLQEGTPDIIGHMDKVKMHNKALHLFDEQAAWYIDEVHKTLELAKEKNVIVEINTKAYYRDGQLFPGPEHFAAIKAMDIPITINSDAHRANKLDNAFADVATLLLEAGFTHLRELIDGQWCDVAFSTEGIEMPVSIQ